MKKEKSKRNSFSLTIVIPFYNSEKTISETIESITNQIDCDWRIIFVNDGSKDKSRNIAESYRLRFEDKIKIIDGANNGLSKARDKALDAVDTDYIMYLDSDDLLIEDVLKFLTDELAFSHHELIVMDYIIESNGQSLYVNNDIFNKSIIRNDEIVNFLEKKVHFSLWTSNIIYSTNFLRENQIKFSVVNEINILQFYVKHMQGEEIMVAFIALLSAEKILYLPKPLATYVQNLTTMSYSFDYSRLGAFYNVIFIVDNYKIKHNDLRLYKIIRNHFYKASLNGLIFNFFVLKQAHERHLSRTISYSKLIKESLTFYPLLFRHYRAIAINNFFSKNLLKTSSWINLGFAFFPVFFLKLLNKYFDNKL